MVGWFELLNSRLCWVKLDLAVLDYHSNECGFSRVSIFLQIFANPTKTDARDWLSWQRWRDQKKISGMSSVYFSSQTFWQISDKVMKVENVWRRSKSFRKLRTVASSSLLSSSSLPSSSMSLFSSPESSKADSLQNCFCQNCLEIKYFLPPILNHSATHQG